MKLRFLILFVVTAGTAFACGPFFPNTFLMFGLESEILRTPDLPLEASSNRRRTNRVPSHNGKVAWQTTLSADEETLNLALGDAVDGDNVVQSYSTMREAIRTHYQRSNRWVPPEERNKILSPRFDWTPHESVIVRLPVEFEFYLRGAEAFYAKDYPNAIGYWELLMALPEVGRPHRSVWAEFMLGRAKLYLDLAESVPHFERTRELVRAGYADPLHLAESSLGWQARALYLERDYREAASLYEQQLETGRTEHTQRAVDSLNRVAYAALSERPVRLDYLKDPVLGERIMSAIDAGRDRTIQDESWIHVMLERGHPMAKSEHLVLLARNEYRAGRFEDAQRWLEQFDGDSGYAHWLRAKLATRSGDLDEARAHYRQALAKSNGLSETLRHKAQAEQGILELGREAFVDALDLFVKAGYELDAAYVAFYVLTIDELQAYVEENGIRDGATTAREYSFDAATLPKLLAIRLARDGHWDRALPHYSPYDRALVERYLEQRKIAEDTEIEKTIRAKAYWEMAKTIHRNGVAITGIHPTHYAQFLEGPYSLDRHWENRQLDTRRPGRVKDGPILIASAEEQARSQRHREHWRGALHTRYMAADALWSCAELWPDNDLRTARALYDGGTILKVYDPQAADRFYKALVNRCRNLPIGKAADAKRWFPSQAPPLPDGLSPIR